MLLVLFCTACASHSPKPLKPYYLYVIKYGGKATGFPMVVPTHPEVEKKTSEMIGYMCMDPDTWAERQIYINELEMRANDR